MSNNQETRPFPDVEAVLATVARLFASEGDLLAVDLLSTAQPRFEWSSHDNWDGGFDMYNLYLEIPLALYSKVGDRRQSLEQRIRPHIRSCSGSEYYSQDDRRQGLAKEGQEMGRH